MQTLSRRLRIHIIFCALLFLSTAATARAADQPAEPTQPQAAQELDDGALEVGVWYVQDYENCGGWGLGDLPVTAPDALGLRNRLTATNAFIFLPYPSPRWSAPLVWGNGLAWEQDWKRSAAGGTENSQIDTVDLAYFAGHGVSSGFFFGVGGNSWDDCQVTKSDSQAAWGTLDNDWIGLAACNVLDDPFSNYQGWASSINGTRLLMGMKTVMSDVDFGVPLGWYLRWNKNFTQAWFTATDEKLPQGQVARIVAEDSAYFYDTWANHASPTVVNSTFSWWTHPAGSEPARAVEVDRVLQDGMPIFQVAPLSTGQADQRFETLVSAFNLTDTQPITGVVAANDIESLYATNGLYISSDADLQMDQSAGNFIYVNSDELWSQSAVQRAAAVAAAGVTGVQGMTAIDQNDARAIADQFLRNNGLLPSDAQFYEVISDTISTGQDPARLTRGTGAASSAGPAVILDETPTNYQVIYSRILTYQPLSAAGAQQAPIDFSVIGPGAKLKVYVGTQISGTVTAASALQDSVLGGVGGYRQVNPVLAAGTQRPLTTPIMALETATVLLNKIEEKVALSYVPLPATSKEVITETLSYWEGPIGFNQDQLIPVWALLVKATLQDNSTQEYYSYIPVNSQFMAPYADILPLANPGPLPGTQIQLQAADASKTLAQLGIDPALTFVMGTGDPDSYLYSWYRDEVKDENRLLTGTYATAGTLTFSVPDTTGSDDKPAEVRIILVVNDSLSPRDPRVATDEVRLQFSKSYLPTITKGP